MQDLVLSLAQLIAADTHQFLEDSQNSIVQIAQRPLVRAINPATCDPFLNDFRQIYPLFANVSVLDRSGQVICTVLPLPDGEPLSLADAPWFGTAIKANGFTISEPWFSPISHKWVVLLGYPLRDDQGQTVGLLRLSVDLARYQTTFNSITLPTRLNHHHYQYRREP